MESLLKKILRKTVKLKKATILISFKSRSDCYLIHREYHVDL